ncbi:MerR family transcriptional regulator [Catenulispora sp. NF23]|uniref:MerR family transcriptional regulator n=1 Tax=Catenulispora pinistramenti TaxID=2705254 RepID=UPI001BA78C0F|nr:MerR family transcriptional regulator [Catenulispora pinistramenti]MBS2536421.1 MerR family transcriptional regulator [Catenulispora pinistramenti]
MVQVKGDIAGGRRAEPASGQGPELDIAEVAAQTGMAASALRYYERRGLIEPSGRNGLRRAYSPDVLDRLTLIGCAQAAGFTLTQIARFLVSTPSDTELRKQLAVKAATLDEDIARLTRMRDSLRHASTCRHTPLVECPEFKSRINDVRDANGGDGGGDGTNDADTAD